QGFTFASKSRRELIACLKVVGIAETAIPEIQNITEVFLAILASPRATTQTAKQLRRLAEASEQFTDQVVQVELDDAGRDLLVQAIAQLRYRPDFLHRLKEGHHILERALELVDRQRGVRLAREGRPQERARDWMLDELRQILPHHRLVMPRVRRKALEAMAK